MTEAELKEIARQLRHPQGESGIKMGENMHKSNFAMTQAAVALLELQPGQTVIEIGHGSARHLPWLLAQGDDLRYIGLEVSATMHAEAKRLNQSALQSGAVDLKLYDGRTFKLPFPVPQADIFTVNTIYFWDQPEAMMAEIDRILPVGGALVLAFAEKEFMARLPFTPYGFRSYDEAAVVEITASTQLHLDQVETHRDQVFSKAGDPVDRTYQVLRLVKQAPASGKIA
ncbi:MAG: methyltransferase domain-containing protein [Bacteroidota bacterium]